MYRRPDARLIRQISEDEVKSLLVDAQGACQDSRDAVILGFYQVVERMANKHARDGVNADDLMADGFIAVGDCIDAFDLTQDRSFTAYVTFAVDNAIKNSELLFGYTQVPQRFQSFIRFHYKVTQELMHKLFKEPNDTEIALEMARQDQTDRSFDEKLQIYKGRIRDFNASLYKQQRLDLYHQVDEDGEDVYRETISLYDEDPYILEVESDMEIDEIVDTIKSGHKFPFKDTKHIDYDKLMTKLGENFLDHDERLILYHSYGYLDHEKLKDKEINELLDKPMKLTTLSMTRKRIIKRLKNFFD